MAQAHWILRRYARDLLGWLAVLMMKPLRYFPRKPIANIAAAVMRTVGPWLPEHRVGQANLRAAFPEKSPSEIEAILSGAWDNLGRVAVEFLYLNEIAIQTHPDAPGDADVIYDRITAERALAIKDQKAALLFGAHLGNWELPARFGRYYGVEATLLFRAPNIRAIADAVVKLRADSMGTLVRSGFDAPIRLARALERGEKVGMVVDQYDLRGVEVIFFGRTCKASPLLAQLARHFECPIYGVRAVRMADRNRFRGEVTEPIEPVRDAEGRIDVRGTTQAIANVVEAWVREHPHQWLWQHRRWR
ncbi:MAG: lipid A biosynthesis lauroyl acyltransferase [Hyphomicrobiales bacterium]|nr:lipid A biosynthesis lauroyl acyltransferase [Hyphomicrobiales bacterium]